MCGRLSIHTAQLTRLLMSIMQETYPGEDDYNVAPTQTLPVIRRGADGGLECMPMRWWLTPSWSQAPTTQYSMFNAKVETAAKSPAFKKPFQKQHCVVPVSGFYEWYGSANGKQPFLINDQAQKGLLLAGIWDAWRPKGGAGDAAELLSFTLLTAAAHENMRELHHRQPIFLTMEQALNWLDPSNATESMAADLASTLPVPLQMTPVNREVNNARNKGPRCAQALAPPYEVSANISFKAADLSTMEKAKPVEQESFIADS